MPHSNFKWRATEFNLRVEKCSCGQTFECALERDMNRKLRKGPGSLCGPMHRKFCSKPPMVFDEIRVPKKPCTMRERQLNNYERIRKVHNKYLSIWINITIPEHNQEVTLYLQELTSTLPIQNLVQVHP